MLHSFPLVQRKRRLSIPWKGPVSLDNKNNEVALTALLIADLTPEFRLEYYPMSYQRMTNTHMPNPPGIDKKSVLLKREQNE